MSKSWLSLRKGILQDLKEGTNRASCKIAEARTWQPKRRRSEIVSRKIDQQLRCILRKNNTGISAIERTTREPSKKDTEIIES